MIICQVADGVKFGVGQGHRQRQRDESPVWTPTGSKFSMEQTRDRDVVGVPNDLELNLVPIAVFKAVCPPNVARMASGRSFAMIWATTSAVIRFDVSGISHIRVGHDSGWIRIDQDDAIALLFEDAARLGTDNQIRDPDRWRLGRSR